MDGARIAVVGVGAIGACVAAELAQCGRHALLLCARRPGPSITVHAGDRPRTLEAPLHEVDAVRASGPVDWVLLATKAHQSTAAQPWLRALVGARTRVAVLQNGVDAVERISPLVGGSAQILPTVIRFPASCPAPGVVRRDGPGGLAVPEGEAGRAFAALFAGASMPIDLVPDFVTVAWGKLLLNAAVGAVGALTSRSNDFLLAPGGDELVRRLMEEALPVARVEGARLPDDAPQHALALVRDRAVHHRASIAADRLAGRSMEWQVRNAVIGRLGRRHGIATPLNDLVTALLQTADRGSTRVDPYEAHEGLES